MRKALILFSWLAIAAMLVGCAASPKNPDPFESYNRRIYYFNKSIDKTVIKPIAFGYDRVLPSAMKAGVRNVFSNLEELPIIGNGLLQGRLHHAASAAARFMVNSTIGVGGLFDIATYGGLVKQQADFGQTLDKWGYHDSAYLVLPLLGPSTVRDTVGRLGDFGMSVWPHLNKNRYWWMAKGLEGLSMRAELLKREKILNAAALDEYKFVRDAYLQRRQNLLMRGSNNQRDDVLEGPPA